MWCSSTRKLSQLTSCSFSVGGAFICPVNAIRDLSVFLDNDLGPATHVRRTTVHAVLPHSASFVNLRLLPFPGGVTCALKTRIWQLCPGQVSSILTVAPPVCFQCCSSSGVSSKSLQPCLRCPCNSTLAASTTTSRFQGGHHGISCCMVSHHRASMILFVSPTCPVVADFAHHHHINWLFHHSDSHNRRSMHISSSCITPLELTAIWHSIIPVSAHLPSMS